jgi:hypothetical protein
MHHTITDILVEVTEHCVILSPDSFLYFPHVSQTSSQNGTKQSRMRKNRFDQLQDAFKRVKELHNFYTVNYSSV